MIDEICFAEQTDNHIFILDMFFSFICVYSIFVR